MSFIVIFGTLSFPAFAYRQGSELECQLECVWFFVHSTGVVVSLGIDARLVALATVAIVTVVAVTNSAHVRAVSTARGTLRLL